MNPSKESIDDVDLVVYNITRNMRGGVSGPPRTTPLPRPEDELIRLSDEEHRILSDAAMAAVTRAMMFNRRTDWDAISAELDSSVGVALPEFEMFRKSLRQAVRDKLASMASMIVWLTDRGGRSCLLDDILGDETTWHWHMGPLKCTRYGEVSGWGTLRGKNRLSGIFASLNEPRLRLWQAPRILARYAAVRFHKKALKSAGLWPMPMATVHMDRNSVRAVYTELVRDRVAVSVERRLYTRRCSLVKAYGRMRITTAGRKSAAHALNIMAFASGASDCSCSV